MSYVESDLGKRLSNLSASETKQLITFATAGGGMLTAISMLRKASHERLTHLRLLFRQWLGARTLQEFYESWFEDNNFSCDEMFAKCSHGSDEVPCCKLFRPYNMMLRGRCYSLRPLHQRAPNYHGQLSVTLRLLPSWLVSPDGYQQQYVLHFLSHGTEPIAAYHRLYLLRNTTNELVLKLRHYQFLESNGQCQPGGLTNATSIATCHYDGWLRSRLIEPLNCTFYYLRRGVEGLGVCDPYAVVRNYRSITSKDANGTICIPPCERNFREVLRRTRHKNEASDGFKYSIYGEHIFGERRGKVFASVNFYYPDLEYEHFQEILATGITAFTAELGGQTTLFVGATMLTVVQLLLSVGGYLNEWIRPS